MDINKSLLLQNPRLYTGSTTGLLESANNLSDVDDATTARENLGVTEIQDTNESKFAARAPSSGVQFTGTGAITSAEASVSGPIFLRSKLIWPATGSQTAALPSIVSLSTTSTFTAYTFAATFRTAEGKLRVYNYGASSVDYRFATFDLTPFAGALIDLAVVSQGASGPAVYVNSQAVAQDGADSTLGTIPDWADVETRTYTKFRGPCIFDRAVFLSAEYGNVALTADEVGLLHAFGWAALPQYVHTAGAGLIKDFDFSAGADGFASISSTTVTGNVDGIGGVDDTLKLEATIGQIGAYVASSVVPITANKMYRQRGSAYRPSANTGTNGTRTRNQTSADFGLSLVSLPADTWTLIQQDFLALSTPTQIRLMGQDGTSLAVDAGDELYFANLGFDRVGLCGSWDFSQGAGYQQRDISGAGNRMTLTTTGGSRLNPGDLLQVKATVAHGSSGNLQINGQAILPDVGWRLNSIVAESDASITAYVGNVSGGAQLVASVALTANVPKDLTIVSGAAVPTTVNAWSNSSGAANITYTLTYVRSDIT
jgi:hypothetical protein